MNAQKIFLLLLLYQISAQMSRKFSFFAFFPFFVMNYTVNYAIIITVPQIKKSGGDCMFGFGSLRRLLGDIK